MIDPPSHTPRNAPRWGLIRALVLSILLHGLFWSGIGVLFQASPLEEGAGSPTPHPPLELTLQDSRPPTKPDLPREIPRKPAVPEESTRVRPVQAAPPEAAPVPLEPDEALVAPSTPMPETSTTTEPIPPQTISAPPPGGLLRRDALLPSALPGTQGVDLRPRPTGKTTVGDGRIGEGPLSTEDAEAALSRYANEVRSQERASRSLHSKVLRDYGSRMEDAWEVSVSQVKRWPITPQTKLAFAGNQSLTDSRPDWQKGTDISDPCTYQRYSIAWVSLEVDARGALVSHTIVRSSGSSRLDRDALALVQTSAPYPPPEPMDLDARGICRSTWDIGVRLYSQGTCFVPGMKPLVKDIELVGVQ